MTELRATDLAMTREETERLLAAHGVRLGERDLGVLAARTEGWTAGLRLSAMSMEGVVYPTRPTSSPNSPSMRAASVSTWWTRCFDCRRKRSAAC